MESLLLEAGEGRWRSLGAGGREGATGISVDRWGRGGERGGACSCERGAAGNSRFVGGEAEGEALEARG